MTSERADSFSDVQCIGLRFQPHRSAAFRCWNAGINDNFVRKADCSGYIALHEPFIGYTKINLGPNMQFLSTQQCAHQSFSSYFYISFMSLFSL